jgi:hypothetical protein
MTRLNEPRSARRRSKGSASKQIIRIEVTLLGGYKVITTTGLIYLNDKYDFGRYFRD